MTARALAGGPIFVRHGLSLPDGGLPTEEWPLDPAGLGDIARLAEALPPMAVVCSDLRRAVDTAAHFGEPTVDRRLAEVSRPYVGELEEAIRPYFSGLPVEGWEPQADAVARIEAVVAEHGDAIYVSHGTVLSLYLASRCPGLDAFSFWAQLRNPDAWTIRGTDVVRLG